MQQSKNLDKIRGIGGWMERNCQAMRTNGKRIVLRHSHFKNTAFRRSEVKLIRLGYCKDLVYYMAGMLDIRYSRHTNRGRSGWDSTWNRAMDRI